MFLLMKLGIDVDYDWFSRLLFVNITHSLEQIGHTVAGTCASRVVVVMVPLPDPLMTWILAQLFLKIQILTLHIALTLPERSSTSSSSRSSKIKGFLWRSLSCSGSLTSWL